MPRMMRTLRIFRKLQTMPMTTEGAKQLKVACWLVVISAVIILGQGCGARLDPGGQFAGRARLADLGNGMCQQRDGLMWQVEPSEIMASADQALAHAEAMSLGAYDDWRLPSKEELYSLCVLFDMKLAGDCPLHLQGSYWSRNGTTQAGEWQVYSLCGGTDYHYLKSKQGRVLAVRP